MDKHQEAVGQAPGDVCRAFTGACGHCRSRRAGGACRHRKRCTLRGWPYEGGGFAVWFTGPDLDRLPADPRLFLEFYPDKRRR